MNSSEFSTLPASNLIRLIVNPKLWANLTICWTKAIKMVVVYVFTSCLIVNRQKVSTAIIALLNPPFAGGEYGPNPSMDTVSNGYCGRIPLPCLVVLFHLPSAHATQSTYCDAIIIIL